MLRSTLPSETTIFLPGGGGCRPLERSDLEAADQSFTMSDRANRSRGRPQGLLALTSDVVAGGGRRTTARFTKPVSFIQAMTSLPL